MKVKIKTFKSIQEVKNVHKFIIDSFKESMREELIEPLDRVDLYNNMLNLFKEKRRLQIYAEMDGQYIGAVVGQVDGFNNNAVKINVIVVKKQLRMKGLAKDLLKKFEQCCKKEGFSLVKIKENNRANGFIIRAGYIPYLYVSTYQQETVDRIMDLANYNDFKVVRHKIIGESLIIKLDVEQEAVYEDKKAFKKISPEVQAEFIFEKLLSKKGQI